jgi:formimidoylglutamate deiminase
LVVLDGSDPLLATAATEELLDTYIFAVGSAAVRDVMVGGRWVIRERMHAQDAAIRRDYTGALRSLRETFAASPESNGLHQA